MKKTLITALISLFFTLSCVSANAASIVIDGAVYNTVIQANGAERSFLMKIDEGGRYDVVFKPLSDELTGTNGINIPLSYLYMNNNTEDLYMRYNEETFLYKNHDFLDNDTKSLTLKVLNYGMVPAGTYTLNTQFTVYEADTQTQIATCVYMLQLIVLNNQSMTFGVERPTISVAPENAFKKTGKIYTTTQPTVIVNSNCDWELVLDPTGFGDAVGNYFVRVTNATSGVKEKLQTETQINNSGIVIARGEAPANGEIITLQYGIESKDGDIIKNGTYENTLRYILREYGGY